MTTKWHISKKPTLLQSISSWKNYSNIRSMCKKRLASLKKLWKNFEKDQRNEKSIR